MQELNIRKRIFANPQLLTALHLSVWVVGLAAFTIIALNGLDVEMSFYRGLINVFILAGLFYLNSGWLVNKILEKGYYLLYLLCVLLIFVLCSEWRTWMNGYFGWRIGGTNAAENALLLRLFSYISSAGVLMVSTLYQVLQNRYFSEHRDLEMRNRYQEAQLQFLKAQINPHFLFNTLNNIYALALMKSADTPVMILKLSELLRYAIYEGKEKQVLLSREWLHIQKLVELFQMRSETLLNIELQLEGSLEDACIEPMMLLPLVENCFKHADFDSNPQAFVRIHLKVEGDFCIFETANSKSEQPQPKDKTGGVGLANIQERLALKTADSYQFEVLDTGLAFRVQLRLRLSKKTVV